MRLLKPLIPAALLVAIATLPHSASAQGLMITGYADFEASAAALGSDDAQFYFDNHHFNLIAVGRLIEDVFAAAEIEYEHAGEEVALEYGYISYTGFSNLTISAGKFIVPFGRFNKDLHPTWINKMPDRPHGFNNILPQTYNDVGVWLSGGLPVGQSGSRVVFDAYVVNGLLGADSADIRTMRDNDREGLSGGGRDDQKSFGGRLGIELGAPAVDLGASIYRGNYLDDPDVNRTLALYGADAAFHYRGLELRAEGVLADQDVTGGSLTKKGGYVQGAYLIQARFEPVVRFSLRDMPGESRDARRLSLGGNFYVSPNAAVRIAYHVNSEKSGFESDNNQLIVQWSMAF